MKLYHKDIYLPAEVRDAVLAQFPLKLHYSRHALRAALDDALGTIPAKDLPAAIDGVDWLSCAFEVETQDNGVVRKIAFRRPTGIHDLIIVVLCDGLCDGLVKTVWQNRSADGHISLDKSKYEKA
jgi:hypothetical protein